MSNKQQPYEVLSHLKKYKSITSWEAYRNVIKVTRLSARIYELRGRRFRYHLQSILLTIIQLMPSIDL
jgi:hypothetical protein